MTNGDDYDPEEICSNCKKRLVYGYAGNGVVVPNLCKVCYKSGICGIPGRGYHNNPKRGKA